MGKVDPGGRGEKKEMQYLLLTRNLCNPLALGQEVSAMVSIIRVAKLLFLSSSHHCKNRIVEPGSTAPLAIDARTEGY